MNVFFVMMNEMVFYFIGDFVLFLIFCILLMNLLVFFEFIGDCLEKWC